MRIDCPNCDYYYDPTIEIAHIDSPLIKAIGTNRIHKTEFINFGEDIFECPVCNHRFKIFLPGGENE